jgi:S-DNA-T family DNA segregation ATPase FtsK/SpoIIIE
VTRPERDEEEERAVGDVVPIRRDDEPVANSAPADISHQPDQVGADLPQPGEVVDAELLDDDKPVVPGAAPKAPAPPPWASQQPARRPVIAPWVKDRDQRRAAERWLAGYLGHATAYHLVRLPLYCLQIGYLAPLGAGRLARRLVAWLADAEAAPLRSAAVRREATDEYLKLLGRRDDRVRLRRIAAGGALLASGLAFVALTFAPWWVQVPIAVVAAVALAYAGRPIDKPFIGPAVVENRVTRLTSDMVVTALGALGLSELNKAVGGKGTAITFPAPIQRDGPGWRAEVELPHGVTVTDIMERRERLASGLRRPLGCVWPEPAAEDHPGRLVLFVADEDMAVARQAAWPLLRRGAGDLFAPLPFGRDQRGRAVELTLMYSNLLVGAMPGAGKTMALRIPLLAAALDPRAELHVFELKGTGDLSALEAVAHRYASGVDDATIEDALEGLREVYRDLERRAKTIASLPRDVCPENKVTPELAAKRSLRLHPLVIAIDECQELFAHERHGKEASELATAIVKRGRALAVIALYATQRPDKDSLPTGISANVGTRFCLRVMGQVENDMVLGTSMYRNGIRATMFRARDLGIGYLVGAGPDPQIARGYYVDGPAAEAVCARARVARADAGTLTGQAAGDEPDRAPTANLLDDLHAVYVQSVRTDRPGEWSERLCALLAELRPEVYGGWDSDALATALRPYGIETRQLAGVDGDGQRRNRRGVRREDLTAAVAARAERRELGS